jgi:hypothetical protein
MRYLQDRLVALSTEKNDNGLGDKADANRAGDYSMLASAISSLEVTTYYKYSELTPTRPCP